MPGTGTPAIPRQHEEDLVRLAQKGDSEAFGELYRIHADTVFQYVYHRVRTRTLAEDLTSETFLRALRRIAGFAWRENAKFVSWLVTIARNLIADHYKSTRHRMEVCTGELFEGDDQLTPCAEDSALEALADLDLLAAVHRLRGLQRRCVELRYLQELSVAETVRVMGSSEGAVKTLLYRAVRSLARDGELSDSLAVAL